MEIARDRADVQKPWRAVERRRTPPRGLARNEARGARTLRADIDEVLEACEPLKVLDDDGAETSNVRRE